MARELYPSLNNIEKIEIHSNTRVYTLKNKVKYMWLYLQSGGKYLGLGNIRIRNSRGSDLICLMETATEHSSLFARNHK